MLISYIKQFYRLENTLFLNSNPLHYLTFTHSVDYRRNSKMSRHFNYGRTSRWVSEEPGRLHDSTQAVTDTANFKKFKVHHSRG